MKFVFDSINNFKKDAVEMKIPKNIRKVTELAGLLLQAGYMGDTNCLDFSCDENQKPREKTVCKRISGPKCDTVTMVFFAPSKLTLKSHNKLISKITKKFEEQFTKYFDGFVSLKGQISLDLAAEKT